MITIDLYLAIITILFCSGLAYAAGYSVGFDAGEAEGSTGKKGTPLPAPEKPEGVTEVLGTPSEQIPGDETPIPQEFVRDLIRDPANAGRKSSVLSWLLDEWRKRT